eukprot:3936151-Rhodomonas_salina.2
MTNTMAPVEPWVVAGTPRNRSSGPNCNPLPAPLHSVVSPLPHAPPPRTPSRAPPAPLRLLSLLLHSAPHLGVLSLRSSSSSSQSRLGPALFSPIH